MMRTVNFAGIQVKGRTLFLLDPLDFPARFGLSSGHHLLRVLFILGAA